MRNAPATKTDEQRLRNKARRRNLYLVKSAARDTGAADFGLFALLKTPPRGRGQAHAFKFTLADVERILGSAEWKTL